MQKNGTPIDEKTTVHSIAKSLGLSAATVSLALNGRRPTGSISLATRKQVWKAAQEMGYSLDRLRSRRPLVERVAVFTVTSRNPVYSESLLELCRVLNQHQVQVSTYSTRTQREDRDKALELIRRQEVDAAVFVGSRNVPEEMPSSDIPSVFVGEVPAGFPVWQVRADNEGGGRAVGEHLWALGHRSAAVIIPAGTGAHLVSMRRLHGLRAYWAEQGREIPENQVLRMDTDSDASIREAVTAFFSGTRRKKEGVTALFCYNDWTAGIVLKVLRGLDVRVPQDISVVGFDDSVYAELLDPALTTVHHPFGAMGVAAAELLLERAQSLNAEPKVVVARCQLIGRQSCAAAPSEGFQPLAD